MAPSSGNWRHLGKSPIRRRAGAPGYEARAAHATFGAMGSPVADSKTPALIAATMVFVGLALAAIQGLTAGSIAGGVIAALGAVPACYGMWKGIQQETQGTLAISVGAVLLSLAVGGVLILLRVVHWMH